MFKSICISLSTLINIEKPNVHTDTFSSSPKALDLFSFLSSVMGRNLFPTTLNVVTSLIYSPVGKQSLDCCHNPLLHVDASPTTPGLQHPWVPAGRPPPDVLRAVTSWALPPAHTRFFPRLALTLHTRPPPLPRLSFPPHPLSNAPLRSCSHRNALLSLPTDGCSLFFQLSCSFITILYNIN